MQRVETFKAGAFSGGLQRREGVLAVGSIGHQSQPEIDAVHGQAKSLVRAAVETDEGRRAARTERDDVGADDRVVREIDGANRLLETEVAVDGEEAEQIERDVTLCPRQFAGRSIKVERHEVNRAGAD